MPPVDESFWIALETLVGQCEIVIDRPKGSRHPEWPAIVYPLDYGYLKGTTSMDGAGIDVWIGTRPDRRIVGVVCTVDLIKRDSEIKILIGCTPDESAAVMAFANADETMRGALIARAEVSAPVPYS